MPLVRITREFDAVPEKVFRAHTDPEPIARWNGPRSLSTRIEHFDRRTAGAYRYVMARNGFVASRMAEGVHEGYQRLDELLAG
ncbi:MAG: SRPBCC domain-containing protein [Geodermatophilaceae bacterium]